MEFVTKKTIDLSKEEKKGLVELFNEVMERDRTVEEFDRLFLNTCEGFSYHTFSVDENIIVAANTMVPALYYVDDMKVKAVNSVDTMIAKKSKTIIKC